MRKLLLAAVCVALLEGPAHAIVRMDWVAVGNPGNAPDTAGNCNGANCGSVGYPYYISKYDVTNAQYAEFLNAKAASDPLATYSRRSSVSVMTSCSKLNVPSRSQKRTQIRSKGHPF